MEDKKLDQDIGCGLWEIGCVCNECIDIHQKLECSFGQPCGLDDWEETCDCPPIESIKKLLGIKDTVNVGLTINNKCNICGHETNPGITFCYVCYREWWDSFATK